ncbi:hypothetical protein ACHQM5_020821 [Ranunculus cassubicifolius]
MSTEEHPLRPPRSDDPGWEHGTMVNGNKDHVKCKYCDKVTKGGIRRHKLHLVGGFSEVLKCESVPEDVSTSINNFIQGKSKLLLAKKNAKEAMIECQCV